MHQHGVVERERRLQLWKSDCSSIGKRVGSCHGGASREDRSVKQLIVIERKPVSEIGFMCDRGRRVLSQRGII